MLAANHVMASAYPMYQTFLVVSTASVCSATRLYQADISRDLLFKAAWRHLPAGAGVLGGAQLN